MSALLDVTAETPSQPPDSPPALSVFLPPSRLLNPKSISHDAMYCTLDRSAYLLSSEHHEGKRRLDRKEASGCDIAEAL